MIMKNNLKKILIYLLLSLSLILFSGRKVKSWDSIAENYLLLAENICDDSHKCDKIETKDDKNNSDIDDCPPSGCDERASTRIICTPNGCFETEKGTDIIIVISPVNGERLLDTLETNPSIQIEPNNKTYTVKLEDSEGTIFKDNCDGDCELPDKSPDYSGYYRITIETNDTGITRSFEILNENDSEYQEIKQLCDSKINILEEFAECYQEENLITKAREILENALEKGVENNKEAIAIYQRLGDLYLERINAPYLAENNYQEALNKAIEIQDKEGSANAYIGLARVNIESGFDKGKCKKAISNLERAYKIYENLGADFMKAQLQQFIGEVYVDCDDNKEALKSFEEALKIYQRIGKNKYGKAMKKEIAKICNFEDNITEEIKQICRGNL